MGAKIVIVVLVLLGVLFFVGVGIGVTRQDSGPVSLDSPWLTGMHGLLVGDHNLEEGDISTAQPPTCLQNGTLVIAPGQTCRYQIKDSNLSDRKVPLRLLKGTSVTVNLQGQPSALDVNLTLGNSDPAEGLDVYKDGALLVVSCDDVANTCQVGLH